MILELADGSSIIVPSMSFRALLQCRLGRPFINPHLNLLLIYLGYSSVHLVHFVITLFQRVHVP